MTAGLRIANGIVGSKLVDRPRTTAELLQRMPKRSSWSRWKSTRSFLGDAIRNLTTKTVWLKG